MISGHSAELRDNELPADFDYPDVPWPSNGQPMFYSHDLIGPDAQINGAPYVLPIADVLAVANLKKKFFIWGWTEYNDVFDGTSRHRLEYCYQLVVLYDPTNPDNSSALAMGLFGPHNGVDSQCMKRPHT